MTTLGAILLAMTTGLTGFAFGWTMRHYTPTDHPVRARKGGDPYG